MTRAADILAREEELRTLYSELQGITPYGVDKDVYELSRMGYYDLRKFNELVDMLDATELMLIDTKYDYDYDRVSEGSDVLLDWLYELIKQPEIFCARRYPYMICEEMPSSSGATVTSKSSICSLRIVKNGVWFYVTSCYAPFKLECSMLLTEICKLLL